jgi:metallophosphoesterase (TIGR03767 family)
MSGPAQPSQSQPPQNESQAAERPAGAAAARRFVNRRTLLIASGAGAAAAGGSAWAFGPGSGRAGARTAGAASTSGTTAATTPATTKPAPVRTAAAVPPSTEGTTLATVAAPRGRSGYRALTDGPAWKRVVRTESAAAHDGREQRRTPLAAFVQCTDLHLVDVQSPLRFEFMRAHSAADWRPHEALSAAGTVSLIERINGLRGGPVTGHPLSMVITTGDNTDNNSKIELDWFLTAMSGGAIDPNSGGPVRFEGVHNSGLDLYWQPESARPDADKKAGFPHLPGYLAAAVRPLTSPGLNLPWYSTSGNHDALYGGAYVAGGFATSFAAGIATGGRKVERVEPADAARLRKAVRAESDPEGSLYRAVLDHYARSARTVTPDERRAPFTPAEYLAAHLEPRRTGPGPVGHGYAADGVSADRMYYTFQIADGVLGISLDTTNRGGGYQGSIGTGQLQWLERTLTENEDQHVLVFSHHTSHSMTNLRPDPANPHEKRHGGPEFVSLLSRHRNVIAWVNGHSHLNRIESHDGFWEVNTASHVDYPQLARIIELVDNHDGTLSLITTLVESAAPHRADFHDLSQHGLAALYRELAFNAPGADPAALAGGKDDRNAELLLRKR